MTQPNQSNPTNEQELNINRIEEIIADHNKEMRADMASEITGGTRSKAITDVITVKAILDWHNKQVEEVLDRLITSGDSEGRIWVETIKSVLGKLKESSNA